MTSFLFAFVMLMYPVSLGTPSATLLMQMDNVIIHEADMKDVGMMLSLVSDHSYGKVVAYENNQQNKPKIESITII